VAANLAARGVDYNPVTAVRGVVEIGTILYDAKRGNLVHEKMPGISGEQYGAAWEISNRKKPDGKGYSKEEKLRFLREELDLTAGEAKRLYGLMKERIEDE